MAYYTSSVRKLFFTLDDIEGFTSWPDDGTNGTTISSSQYQIITKLNNLAGQGYTYLEKYRLQGYANTYLFCPLTSSSITSSSRSKSGVENNYSSDIYFAVIVSDDNSFPALSELIGDASGATISDYAVSCTMNASPIKLISPTSSIYGLTYAGTDSYYTSYISTSQSLSKFRAFTACIRTSSSSSNFRLFGCVIYRIGYLNNFRGSSLLYSPQLRLPGTTGSSYTMKLNNVNSYSVDTTEGTLSLAVTVHYHNNSGSDPGQHIANFVYRYAYDGVRSAGTATQDYTISSVNTDGPGLVSSFTMSGTKLPYKAQFKLKFENIRNCYYLGYEKCTDTGQINNRYDFYFLNTKRFGNFSSLAMNFDTSESVNADLGWLSDSSSGQHLSNPKDYGVNYATGPNKANIRVITSNEANPPSWTTGYIYNNRKGGFLFPTVVNDSIAENDSTVNEVTNCLGSLKYCNIGPNETIYSHDGEYIDGVFFDYLDNSMQYTNEGDGSMSSKSFNLDLGTVPNVNSDELTNTFGRALFDNYYDDNCYMKGYTYKFSGFRCKPIAAYNVNEYEQYTRSYEFYFHFLYYSPLDIFDSSTRAKDKFWGMKDFPRLTGEVEPEESDYTQIMTNSAINHSTLSAWHKNNNPSELIVGSIVPSVASNVPQLVINDNSFNFIDPEDISENHFYFYNGKYNMAVKQSDGILVEKREANDGVPVTSVLNDSRTEYALQNNVIINSVLNVN